MKKLYTSYYAKSGTHLKAISISANAPAFYSGDKYLALAPSWELIRAYKSGQVDESGYVEWYMRLLKDRKLIPQQVADNLAEESILLCYEKSGDFCHRHIVAEWLEAGADVEVTEVGVDNAPTLIDAVVKF